MCVSEYSVDLSILLIARDIVLMSSALFCSHVELRAIARPLKFDTNDRFACMIHHWKAKNLLCNINLVKLFGIYALLNTGSAAKNLRSRCDHNLSAWNQYYRPSCI